jgi:hypothetical protein
MTDETVSSKGCVIHLSTEWRVLIVLYCQVQYPLFIPAMVVDVTEGDFIFVMSAAIVPV